MAKVIGNWLENGEPEKVKISVVNVIQLEQKKPKI